MMQKTMPKTGSARLRILVPLLVISGCSDTKSQPADDTTAPTTPTGLHVTRTSLTTVALSWTASTDSGGSGLAGYDIYRDESGAESPVAHVIADDTSFVDSGRQFNTSYTYSVRARDLSGNVSPPSAPVSVITESYKKVAYFTQWSIYGRNFRLKDVEQLAQAEKLTHINYAFANIDEHGRCFEAAAPAADASADYQARFSAEQSVDGVADEPDQPLAGNFYQIKKLKEKHPKLRVLLSIGGWSWSKFFSNAALPENRAAFVASCIDLFIKGNLPIMGEPQGGDGVASGIFDGFDLDWEWPGSDGNVGNVMRPEDNQHFAALVQEFRAQLDAYGAKVGRRYELSAFLPAAPARIAAGFTRAIFDALDFATVQGYDYYGAWEAQTNLQSQLVSPSENPSPSKFSAEVALGAWHAMGAPSDRLVLGVPAYGRGWTNVPNVNRGLYQGGVPAPGLWEAGIDDYKVIKDKPGDIYRDQANGALWKFDGSNFWTYDDPQLVREKAGYVKTKGLGGVMMWSLDGDDGSLVDAMSAGLP